MATTMSIGIPVEKLKGLEDYNHWKFMLKMILMHEDLYDCIKDDKEEGCCKDEKKRQKALAKICLSVGPSALPHVRNATTPYEAWTNLQRAYEDKGLCRRLGLLRSLFGVKLCDTENMQSYLSKITELGQQLSDIGSCLDDEFLAVIMLSGLTVDFDPLIMALENSNVRLTSDAVKSKLLQEQQRRDDKEQSGINALATRKYTKAVCFKCKKPGHLKKDCTSNMKTGSKKNMVQRPNEKATPENSLLTALSVNLQRNAWYIDSGATHHMCNDKRLMNNFSYTKSLEVNVANGDKVTTEGHGSVEVHLSNGLKTISGVYYIPKLSVNLLSVSELSRKGYSVIFSTTGCKIMNNSVVIATGTCNNGVYELDIIQGVNSKCSSQLQESGMVMNSVCAESEVSGLSGDRQDVALVSAQGPHAQELWHKRLAHLNGRSMNLMKNGLVTGMDFKNTPFNPCTACVEGKQTRLPFPKKSQSRSTEILGLVHTDVCGPMQSSSFSGARYFVTFIDDYTRKTFVYFLQRKSEVFEKFKLFKTHAENQTNKKIKILRSDNGGEYVSLTFQEYLKHSGIKHQTTVPHCSEQNGVAERANRTIMDKARCMLQEAGLEKGYWAEAANTAIYLKNRSPTKAVMGATPEQKWTSQKVNVAHLRVFGCVAYAINENAKKLDARSKRYIFVGYCDDSKGYRLIDPSCPKKCIKARHVAFMENQFLNKNVSNDEARIDQDTVVFLDSSFSTSSVDSTVKPNLVQLPADTDSLSPQSIISIDDDSLSDDTSPNTRRQTVLGLNREEDSVVTDDSADETYIPGQSSMDSQDSSMSIEEKTLEYAGLTEIGEEDLPGTVEEALSSSESQQWKEAIQDEYDSFMTNKCWTPVDLPAGQKPVKCKWVFTKKRGLNGEILKYKARLVAKGFTQKYGIDYHETFSPVVRYSTIRIMLALAAQNDMVVEHLDVKTAFLNGYLEENVYMEQPEGFIIDKNKKKVYKLNKAIYGLKQSAKAWYERINDVLSNKMNFRRLSSEPCVYIYNDDDEIMFIALYVDDIMLFSSKTSQKRKLIKEKLMKQFEMKDLGPAHQILGMKITRLTDGSYTLDQSSYIRKIVDKFKMADCKEAKTPMEVGLKLQREENMNCNFDYRSLIGCLMYLAVCSRPDIAHSVSYLSQFNNCYGESHWKAAKRVLRYIKGTSKYFLIFQKGNLEITGFTDADWGGDQIDRRSYTGYVFCLGKSIISWESRKQRTVALSSTEAEYMAISDSCKEAMFLQTFVKECSGSVCKINLYNDNQSAQKLCTNFVSHSRTKHIDIRHHYIRELINRKLINLSYLSTEEMLADVLTKSLSCEKHSKFVSKLLKKHIVG